MDDNDQEALLAQQTEGRQIDDEEHDDDDDVDVLEYKEGVDYGDAPDSEDEEAEAELQKYRDLKQSLEALLDAHQYSGDDLDHLESLLAEATARVAQYDDKSNQVNVDEVVLDPKDDASDLWDKYDAVDYSATDAKASKGKPKRPKKQPASAQQASAVAAAAPDLAAASYKVNYAPNLPPVKGTFDVCCIALAWNDGKEVKLSQAKSLANAVASNYKRLSHGNLVLRVTTKVVRVNYNYARKNLAPAESQAKAIVNKARGGKYDRYLIINHGLGSVSHASGDTAHLLGTLKRDGWHEIGHILPNDGSKRRLAHSGRYVTEKGKRVLEAYGDGSSFMGRFSTDEINAPQLYYLGWAGNNKTAQYDVNDGVREFLIQPYLSKKDNPDCVTGVLIPRENGRPRFVSVGPVGKSSSLLFSCHYMTGGGTQRDMVFNRTATWEGMVFERVEQNGSYAVLRISPAPETKLKLKA